MSFSDCIGKEEDVDDQTGDPQGQGKLQKLVVGVFPVLFPAGNVDGLKDPVRGRSGQQALWRVSHQGFESSAPDFQTASQQPVDII